MASISYVGGSSRRNEPAPDPLGIGAHPSLQRHRSRLTTIQKRQRRCRRRCREERRRPEKVAMLNNSASVGPSSARHIVHSWIRMLSEPRRDVAMSNAIRNRMKNNGSRWRILRHSHALDRFRPPKKLNLSDNYSFLTQHLIGEWNC